MISKSPEDLQYYEDRLKFLRDEQGKLQAARQEGRQEGMVAGKIQTLQELLGESVTSDEVLLAQGLAELSAQLEMLQQRLRDREA